MTLNGAAIANADAIANVLFVLAAVFSRRDSIDEDLDLQAQFMKKNHDAMDMRKETIKKNVV